MKDMPRSAQRWYKMWLAGFPDSWHPNDLERFYMFVSVLLVNSRKTRSGLWLRDNLREDAPELGEEVIIEYVEIFEHIRDYSVVWKSQQAKLIAQDDFEDHIAELKKQSAMVLSTTSNP